MRVEAIKADIGKKTLKAMNMAAPEFKEIIDYTIVFRFYSDYDPVQYSRTGIFGNSGFNGPAFPVGIGAYAVVGAEDKGGHSFKKGSDWNDARVFAESMSGGHGGLPSPQSGDMWGHILQNISAQYKPVIIGCLAAAGL